MTTVALCVVWALWPLVALPGGLGFSTLGGLAALATAPQALRRFRPRFYLIPLGLFFVYAAASTYWSPLHKPLIDFDFAKNAFAVRSEVLRIAPLFAALGLLLAAAQGLDEKAAARVSTVARWALVLQLVFVAGLTLFERPAEEFIRPLVPDTGETVQNITRNSLIMAVAAPALIALLARDRPMRQVSFLALIIGVVEAAILAYRDVDAGILALALACIAIGGTRLLPKSGFRVLAVLMAAGLLLSPLIFGVLSHNANAETASTSSQWRLAIWKRTLEVISQHPWFGSGVGALRTYREYIPEGPFAGQLYIPNHPHNMALQLWAETGLAGALLLAAALVLAGWRLPSPKDMGRSAWHVAGLVGASLPIAFVSFDLWNDWWWAVVGLLATLGAVAPKLIREVRETSTARGIVFGRPFASAVADEASAAATPASAARGPDLTSAHANNFNLLRLIFAVMVAVYHVARLSGAWTSALPWLEVGAEVGVQGFFIVSGYLVYASLERSSSLGRYAEKRIRRLYPAYAVVILASALGALLLVPAARSNFGDVARYLGANIVFLNFLEPNLPGVFSHNPLSEVNGALWTLKIEVLFYLVLPVIGWLLQIAGRGRWIVIAVMYVVAEIWRYAFEHAGPTRGAMAEIGRQLPGQLSFFITGVALYLARDAINWRSLLLPVAILALAASFLSPAFEVLRAAGLGVVVVWLAVGAPRLMDAARYGDLSYGLYIVHFPVIQIVVAFGLFARPTQGAAIVLLAALALSLAMWWLIERPALRRDSAYRMGG